MIPHPHRPRLSLPRHLHRHLRLPPEEQGRRRRGVLPRGPFDRPVRVRAVAVRHEHDRLLDPRLVGPLVHERDRHLRPDGLVVRARDPAVAAVSRHAHLGARPAPRLHDAGADVPRPLGMRPHRHRHLRGAGRAAGALHHHRRDGRRHDAARGERRARAVLARRRAGRARHHELRVLRRHARHRARQHVSDAAVPRLRRGDAHGDRHGHGRLRPGDRRDGRRSDAVGAADARARVAVVFLQLHVHPALLDRLPAHRHLLSHGAEAVALQAHGDSLSAVHDRHLAALRLPRRRRQSRDGSAGDPDEAGSARRRWPPAPRR